MNAEAIAARLRHAEYRVTVLPQVDSTNSALRARAEQGAAAGEVLIAERQTGGRGRRGHTFFSPAGGVYLSLLLRPDEPAEDAAARITVTAAVAGARAAEEIFGGSVTVKWVNDLYRGGRKVAGILTEGDAEPGTNLLRRAIVGIGFNVTPPDGGFPAEIAQTAGALCETCGDADRERLAARFLDCFADLRQTPWSAVLEEYRRRSFLIGRKVTSAAFSGSASVLGIDGRARLRVRTEDGEERLLSSGEVSVCPEKEENGSFA